MVVAGVHALFRLPLSMLGLAASLLLPEGQAPKAPASEPSKDVRQANLELERGYAQHVQVRALSRQGASQMGFAVCLTRRCTDATAQELTMEIKRQKTAKRDYQAKYLAVSRAGAHTTGSSARCPGTLFRWL